MYKVIDNYLPKSYHKEIKNLLTGSDFPWYYNNNISDIAKPTGTTHFNEYGFNHHFYTYAEDGSGGQRSGFGAVFIKPFLLQAMDTVNCDKILRCRADMVTWSSEEYIHPAHVDFIFPNVATIYYVNDTDGDTLFYGKNSFVKDIKIDQDRFGTLSQTIGSETTTLEIKERISPKANRLVMFDGNLLHTGSSPTKHKTRILINSNFQI